MDIQSNAIEVIESELLAIEKLKNFIDADFEKAIEIIHQSQGRVIVTGIGKSALISQKIVATLNSTGTPAIFMHAADAIHGDLGMIQTNDIVICISKSGHSSEIKVLLPLIKRGGNILIAMTGNKDSFLAKEADIILRTDIDKEACPFNLAPTASSTSQIVMGDAIAICLLKLKSFDPKDFAKFHPGGALGKKLYLKVNDLIKNNALPIVKSTSNVRIVLEIITSNRLGATAVIDSEKVVGIITDGDIRRMLMHAEALEQKQAKDIMSSSPVCISADAYAIEAYQTMKKHAINHIVVLNDGKYSGMVHIQDLINEGIV